MSSCGNALAMFLNGASIVRFQVISASVFGVGCVIAKVLFAQHFGISGVPWSTILTYALFSALPYFFYVPRVLKEMAARHQPPILEPVAYRAIEE
jgi:hypothetical protein